MTDSTQSLQQLNRVDFLFKASHGMLFNVPSLSRYYMNEYHSTLKEYELVLHKGLQRVACQQCGQIRLPGLNTRVELIKYKKKNRLLTTCTICCSTIKYNGSNKKKIPKATITSQNIPTPTAVKITETTKKKKNKGKKNNLKALLSKSTSNNSSSSSLGDFLSSL